MITRARKNGMTESKLGVIEQAKKAIETCKMMGMLISDQSVLDNRRRKQGVVEDHPLVIIDTNMNNNDQQCKIRKPSWFRKCSKESNVVLNCQNTVLCATESTNLLQRNSEDLDERKKESKITSSRTIPSPTLPRFFKTFIKENETLEENKNNVLNNAKTDQTNRSNQKTDQTNRSNQKTDQTNRSNQKIDHTNRSNKTIDQTNYSNKTIDQSNRSNQGTDQTNRSNQITDQIIFSPLTSDALDFKKLNVDLLQYPLPESDIDFNNSNLNRPIKFAYKRCLLKNSQTPNNYYAPSPDLSLRTCIPKCYANNPMLLNERPSVPLNFIPGVKNFETLNKIRKKRLFWISFC